MLIMLLDLIIKESKGQVRDLLKLLQVAAEQGYTTAEQFSKFLALPDTKGMGAFLQAILDSDAKLAVKVLKSLNTDLLEWCNRLESLIYEILEDKFNITQLSGPIQQVAKLEDLANRHTPQEFGKILDYLLKITKSDTAYQLLYVLALLGVEEI